MGNMQPPLETHSTVAPIPTTAWEEDTLTIAEYEKIRQFVKQIGRLKDDGLSRVGVAASFIRRRIQPLQDRLHYGFEYIGPEDTTRQATEELPDNVVHYQVQNILKLVEKMPYEYPEYRASNPPPPVCGVV